jgi:hypothetical protein
MTIDWAAFFVVTLVTLVGSSGLVALYSLGLRLVDSERGFRHTAGVACFVLCGLVVLFAVYLIVPVLH